MTVKEFILARLGRMILSIAFLFGAAAFLLGTGTQSGIITLLLIVCLLIFLLEQLSGFWRIKKRLNELQTIMSELDQRVFDRGFTGRNGRNRGGSTGMGLYLCKRLADALEIGLQIQSAEGAGTRVTLTFPAEVNLTDM